MPAYPPFAPGASYDTQLDPLAELSFRQWVAQNNVPFDPSAQGPSDYDMRGYYRGMVQGNPMATSGVNPNDNRMHYTDYYKTPLHQTFSAESQWAGPDAPQWINDRQLAAPSGRILKTEGTPTLAEILLGQR